MAKVTRLSLDSSGGLEKRRLHLREISADADAPLETVGQDLRKARQRKGEDLTQIARVLKIRKDYLDALEESNFDAIPGRAYTIGFVRSYAQYLGLDAPGCVERVKVEIAGRSEIRDAIVQVSSPRERKLPQGGIIFAILLALALIYGVYYIFIAVNRMGMQPVTPVPPRLAAQADLPPANAPVPPVPQAAAAAPAPEASTVTVPPAPAPQTNTPLPEGHKYGVQNNSRITLLAHKPTRVTVFGPSRRLLLDRQLQPGDSYLVPNTEGLTLSTTDGGALEFILDGAPAGYAGQNGLVAEGLSLNPQDVAGRKARG
ncbi:MAG TPA: helix-turn-helix domain-containing protein [Micropepsaceae bacterium]|nr:helix-turn-helix domain-containing protein [Micropepsaceae bacterium]